MDQRNTFLNNDPLRMMGNFWWCHFNYKDYDLSKDEVQIINDLMVSRASEHCTYESMDSSLSRDSVYLQLLKGTEYNVVSDTQEESGMKGNLYQCTYIGCGKNFTRAWNLLNHSNMHKEIKPYVCMICYKRFTQKGNLKKHTLTHLLPNIENRKRYKCDKCGRSYTERYNYAVRHLKNSMHITRLSRWFTW